MDMDEIRCLYKEFQGILAQTPQPEAGISSAFLRMNQGTVESYHSAIAQLKKITGKSWDRFVLPLKDEYGRGLPLVDFRQRLGQLINRMHAEYFSEEPEPFSGVPDTVIHQTTSVAQSQQVEIQIAMILQLDRFVGDKINDYEAGSKERSFLERLRAGINSAKSYLDFARLLVQTAKDCGIDVSTIASIFN